MGESEFRVGSSEETVESSKAYQAEMEKKDDAKNRQALEQKLKAANRAREVA